MTKREVIREIEVMRDAGIISDRVAAEALRILSDRTRRHRWPPTVHDAARVVLREAERQIGSES